MPAPEIRELPAAPQVTDSPTEFNSKAFTFVDALSDFTEDANALGEWINDNVSATVLNTETNGDGFMISADAPGAEGGPRDYGISIGRNPGTQFAPLVKVTSIGTDEDEEVYFEEEVITESSSRLINLSVTPAKDFHSVTTGADGIEVRSRLWVNESAKIATVHFVIKGTATATIETNLGTISNNSDHGVDTFIDVGSGVASSTSKLVIPLYSNQAFATSSIPAIVGAIKIDSSANAWINLNNGADFSTGQVITVTYKIK